MDTCGLGVSTLVVRFLPRAILFGLAISLIAAMPKLALAQPTVESLTGSSDVGPHYQDVEDAIRRFQARDLEGARRLLEEARKKSPQLAPVSLMIAQLLYNSGQRSQAVGELERAVKADPDDPEPYVLMGDISYGEGRISESVLIFDRAIKLADAHTGNAQRKKQLQSRAHAGAAAAFENREDWKAARPHLEIWAKLDPDKAPPHLRLGRALFELGARKEAYQELLIGSKADPKVPPAELTLASLYQAAGDKTSAEKWIKVALQRNRGGSVELPVARALLSMGQAKQAEPHADQAVKADPNSLEANLVRGMTARMLKDYETATRYFEKAHLLSPSNVQAMRQLAIVLVESKDEGERKRALDFAETLSRQARGNAEATATLGWVQFRLGRLADAERSFNTVLSGGSLNSEIAYFAANLLREQGRTDAAMKLLDLSLRNESSFVYREDAEALRAKLKSQDSAIGNGTSPDKKK